MKSLRWLVLLLTFLLISCQPQAPSSITIIDGGQIQHVTSAERVPLILFTQNGIAPQPNDRVLLNGVPFPIDQSLPSTGYIQLQLRRAVTLNIVTSQGQQAIQSSAFTVGQALNEAGYSLDTNDLFDPPAETAITQSMTITYTPARDLTISVGESTLKVRSAAGTVGEVLAEAGIPLIGADTSSPLENEAPPSDGQIHVTRVYETTSVELKPIPFTTKRIESVDIPLGQEDLI
ncbi:MAG: DUF348 domain-containing protein, partial [Chloroflexi bacterium]|nr:DUF348 domain-containing protein [Chloroflexota bacterium]